MSLLLILIKRNIKLFFKDKGMFFTSLITPAILLFLYVTFLGNVYKNSIIANLPQNISLSTKLIDGLVGGQLVSSLLAVSCVTISFCSNFLMVQDKANGIIKDLKISSVKTSTLSISYFFASFISTLIISFVALICCFIYLFVIGWYLSVIDVLLLMLDVIILVLFGTAVSSIINYFFTTQGQISAIGTIVSAGYGFICGAYMPISSFSTGLQKIIGFLPGTYGMVLMRNHCMNGVLEKMESQGVPLEVISNMKNSFDCNFYFFNNQVNFSTMYIILVVAIIAFSSIYIGLNIFKSKIKKD